MSIAPAGTVQERAGTGAHVSATKMKRREATAVWIAVCVTVGVALGVLAATGIVAGAIYVASREPVVNTECQCEACL